MSGNQMISNQGTATITVVSNAAGQTLLVQQPNIVNTSNAIMKKEDDMNESGGDSNAESGPRTIVENAHYITVSDASVAARSYTSLTPVTPSIVQEAEPVSADGIYVSTGYVESAPEQTIYTTNGQMAYPLYTVGGDSGTAMYTPTSGQYYPTSSNNTVAYSQVIRVANQSGNQTQILNNGQYLLPADSDHMIATSSRESPTLNADTVSFLVNTTNGNNGNSGSTSNNDSKYDNVPETANNINHVTRIPQITVQWLLENYETADGVSLPRSTLYYYYMHHCNESKLDPVNAASFGKLIRSVFIGLRTRRLGTRGNSKYHYYGIRLKQDSPLHNLAVSEDTGAYSSRASNGQYKRFRNNKLETSETTTAAFAAAGGGESNHSSITTTTVSSSPEPKNATNKYLGDSSSAIPDFPEIQLNRDSLPEDCSLEDVDAFKSIYREHCEMFLHSVENLEFTTIETLWREFWRCHDTLEDCEEEKYLSKTKLFLLSKCPAIQDFVRYVDYRFYQNIVTLLVPDVLRPIPASLTQSLRNFAKSLETWLKSAMDGCPKEMIIIKATAVGAFAQTLRRYTSLNHLAQAARAVLLNPAQINQMLSDLNRVDFHNVQEQAAWVCQCDAEVINRVEEDFKNTLRQHNTLEDWANWLRSVVDEALKPHQGKESYIKAARQFLLKWSFYSSMVIRDLTLRSAASFGSFHLIRLLYDEYMFYIIEHEVAKVTGETPISAMKEKLSTPSPEYTLEDMDKSMYADLIEDTTTECANGGSLSLVPLDEEESSLLMLEDLPKPSLKKRKHS